MAASGFSERRRGGLLTPVKAAEIVLSSSVGAGGNARWVVLEVGHGGEREFQSGHLPGAVYLDTDSIETGSDWTIAPPEVLRSVVLEYGITSHTGVIAYGRRALPALRTIWMLLYLGVSDVRLLNGGYHIWTHAGYPTSRAVSPQSAIDFGSAVPAHPEFLATPSDVDPASREPQSLIVDVRSRAEYDGEATGYAYVKDPGRIPSAVLGGGGSGPHAMEPFRVTGEWLRDSQDIASRWARSGITRDQDVIFYCGTAWRASEAFFHAYLLGWPKIRVFDGGWLHWSRANRP